MLKTCFRVVNFFSTGEVFIINQHHGPLLIEEIPPLGAPGVMLDSSDDDDDSVESSDEESEGDDDDSLVNNFIDYGDGDVLNALIAYPQAEVTEGAEVVESLVQRFWRWWSHFSPKLPLLMSVRWCRSSSVRRCRW